MRVVNILSICLLIAFHVAAQDQFNLSGTVKNQADFQVLNLICELVESGYADTTDSSGTFTIIGDATSILSSVKKAKPVPQCNGSQILVPVTSGAQPVSIEVYNVKGLKVATVFNRMLPKGEHAIPFGPKMNTVSQSVLIAVVRRGSDVSKFRLIKAGSRNFMVQKIGSAVSGSNQSVTAASHQARVLDSLRFKRCLEVEGNQEEFVEFTIPVENLEDEFKVTLDLIPYEAIEWGMKEDGRDDYAVGKELEEQNIYPYGFQRYNNSSDPAKWQWCSEFYSYCMRIGGCPLDDDGGTATSPNWMEFGWNKLIEWFEDNAQYVEKGDITSEDYIPNPGDFIQMNEHTAMVRYINDDEDVVCLDGNWGDRVVLSTRGNYKTFSGLNGYGRRSGLTENTWESVK